VIVWKELGFGTILFLARLMSMDTELLEAATIDGANWWQKLFFISIPQLRTAMEFYVIITTINMLSWMFPYIYIMTTGGPANSTMITELYIFQHGFRYQMMGVACACAVLLLVITSILIFLQFRIRGGMAIEKE
jgi:ABC-type sugar transport system permease subunit